jgi:hypothetical protein
MHHARFGGPAIWPLWIKLKISGSAEKYQRTM